MRVGFIRVVRKRIWNDRTRRRNKLCKGSTASDDAKSQAWKNERAKRPVDGGKSATDKGGVGWRKGDLFAQKD